MKTEKQLENLRLEYFRLGGNYAKDTLNSLYNKINAINKTKKIQFCLCDECGECVNIKAKKCPYCHKNPWKTKRKSGHLHDSCQCWAGCA